MWVPVACRDVRCARSAVKVVKDSAAGRKEHAYEAGLVKVMGPGTGDGIRDHQDAVVAFPGCEFLQLTGERHLRIEGVGAVRSANCRTQSPTIRAA
jgi:hypothetical protein